MTQQAEKIFLTPEYLADKLKAGFPPTPEQSEVIAANLNPRLVIAGAGSGKTATMADRVAWLVANGLARPEQILGVTFTRKAAGELSERINGKLRALESENLLPELPADQSFGEPMVSTYHSYAQSLVREHGLRLGLEPDAELITKARAVIIIRQILDEQLDLLTDVNSAQSTIIDACSGLCDESSEHLKTAQDALEAHQKFESDIVGPVLQYSQANGRNKSIPQAAHDFATRNKDQQIIAQVAGLYQQYKRDNQLLDYGDLVKYAAQLAKKFPDVGKTEREKYKVVLLDEFQDTSHAQLELFASLFGNGHSVTAVGDPNQSIYGFRGASAGQLKAFRFRFPLVGPDGEKSNSEISYLTIAWRNSRAVLDVANKIVAGFPQQPHGLEMQNLRAPETANEGLVELGSYISDEDEAKAIVARLQEQRDLHELEQRKQPEKGQKPPTMAVLIRKTSQSVAIINALKEAGVEYEELALSGLLTTPEIRDLRAVLAIMADPMNNHGVLRILTGAKYMMGTRDLHRFHEWAKKTQRIWARPDQDFHVDDDDHAVSLSEALERLRAIQDSDSEQPDITPAARHRLLHFAELLQRFHEYPRHDLAAYIRFIEQELGLDVELLANPSKQVSTARGNVESFLQVARDFQFSAGAADIGAFLDWLEIVIDEERGLEKQAEEPTPGAVQILTAHASKGLEWDFVVVPGLNSGGLSEHVDRPEDWIATLGKLPWELRGDVANLPKFTGEPDPELSWTKWKNNTLDIFRDEVKAHLGIEERRLAYVAATRARNYLLLTNHRFAGTAKKPKTMSQFFLESTELVSESAHPVRLLTDIEVGQELEENPRADEVLVNWWPQDPFDPTEPIQIQEESLPDVLRQGWTPTETPTKDALQKAAAMVKESDAKTLPDNERGHRIQFMIDQLQQRKDAHKKISVPESINPSTIVQLAKNPEHVMEQWRRPMPEKPSKHARRGTAFHTWVEQHFGHTHLLDIEEVREYTDAELDERLDLGGMKENFLASRFATMQPIAIEVALQTPLAGVVVPGRIDAVFATEDGGVELVDWKTGRVPQGQELIDNSIQMALYRLGWSRLKNMPLEKIRATFFYTAHNKIVDVTELVDENTMQKIIDSVRENSATAALPTKA